MTRRPEALPSAKPRTASPHTVGIPGCAERDEGARAQPWGSLARAGEAEHARPNREAQLGGNSIVAELGQAERGKERSRDRLRREGVRQASPTTSERWEGCVLDAECEGFVKLGCNIAKSGGFIFASAPAVYSAPARISQFDCPCFTSVRPAANAGSVHAGVAADSVGHDRKVSESPAAISARATFKRATRRRDQTTYRFPVGMPFVNVHLKPAIRIGHATAPETEPIELSRFCKKLYCWDTIRVVWLNSINYVSAGQQLEYKAVCRGTSRYELPAIDPEQLFPMCIVHENPRDPCSRQ